MTLQKHLRFLLGLLYTALAFIAVSLVLPGLLPFLLGWGIASLGEPAMRFLCEKSHLRRGPAAALVLLLFSALLAAGSYFLFRRLWFELTVLSAKLPVWMESLHRLGQRLDHLVYRWTVAVSPEIRTALQTALEGILRQLSDLLSSLSFSLLEWGAGVLLSLPRIVLFLFTTLLASYFILAGKPTLKAFFQKQLPARWLPHLKKILQRLKNALGGWLKAQGFLMTVTFLLLLAGLLMIRTDAAVLLAAGIALLDALPIFGTGPILLPWAAFCILNGELRRGISLTVLYAVLWLVRNILEPKLIANRAGLHPLAALLSMYLGFSLFGVAGMLLAPLCAVFAVQLWAGDILHTQKN